MSDYIFLFISWNIFVMLVYEIDKILAKLHKRRISETTLLLCAFFMGGLGAMFGMVVFNHKTSKTKFRILIPLFALLGIFVIFKL